MCAQQHDTLDLYSLPQEIRFQVNDSSQKWEQNCFTPFLKRNRIKLSCAHCNSVFVEAVFRLQEGGHSHFVITRQKKCGQSFSKTQLKEIEKMLLNLQLPESVRGKLIRLRFGNSLKC
jgi:hypothetical protein